MSGYLQYSNYGDEDETPVKRKVPIPTPTQPGGTIKPTQQKRILRTNQRTLRSRPPPEQSGQSGQQQHKYVQELIQKIHSCENGDSDIDSDNNYEPFEQARQQATDQPFNNSIRQQFQTESVPQRNRIAGATSDNLNGWNPAPAKEAFSLQEAKALAQEYMPSVFPASTASADENKDVLLQKLDHIISLLENQQDEKTGHVTEELVLYCFLGVFIIFIVDSFARAGKYVR